MSDPKFGWGAGEVIGVLRFCERVLLLYLPGPHSASQQYALLFSELEIFRSNLSSLRNHFATSHSGTFHNELIVLRISRQAVQRTLSDCEAFFEARRRFPTSRVDRAVAALQNVVYDGELATELSRRLSQHSQQLLLQWADFSYVENRAGFEALRRQHQEDFAGINDRVDRLTDRLTDLITRERQHSIATLPSSLAQGLNPVEQDDQYDNPTEIVRRQQQIHRDLVTNGDLEPEALDYVNLLIQENHNVAENARTRTQNMAINRQNASYVEMHHTGDWMSQLSMSTQDISGGSTSGVTGVPTCDAEASFRQPDREDVIENCTVELINKKQEWSDKVRCMAKISVIAESTYVIRFVLPEDPSSCLLTLNFTDGAQRPIPRFGINDKNVFLNDYTCMQTLGNTKRCSFTFQSDEECKRFQECVYDKIFVGSIVTHRVWLDGVKHAEKVYASIWKDRNVRRSSYSSQGLEQDDFSLKSDFSITYWQKIPQDNRHIRVIRLSSNSQIYWQHGARYGALKMENCVQLNKHKELKKATLEIQCKADMSQLAYYLQSRQ